MFVLCLFQSDLSALGCWWVAVSRSRLPIEAVQQRWSFVTKRSFVWTHRREYGSEGSFICR